MPFIDFVFSSNSCRLVAGMRGEGRTRSTIAVLPAQVLCFCIYLRVVFAPLIDGENGSSRQCVQVGGSVVSCESSFLFSSTWHTSVNTAIEEKTKGIPNDAR